MSTLLALLALVGSLNFGDATISGWTVPSISGNKTGTGAAALTVQEDKAVSFQIAALAATTEAGKTVAYTLLTADVPFAVAGTGELTVNTALDFETTSSYTIEVQAVDTADTPDTGTATITITVQDVNEAPVFASTSYSVCVADGLAADASVYAVTATDQDTGNTITYSIGAGNTLGDFQNTVSEIQVNTGKTLDRATTDSYTLEFEAADAALTGTTTIAVTVGECSTATTFAVSIVTLLLTLVTALNSF